ncbi:GntR family transcriptional regulator [Photobacterium sp. 1_MG-2023]|uniref:GntR family transcriptional regulator n=1 Tax=Photobacterium sp. 1_MG-2023 TaxID=3062646 RepID=UPI0026E172D1|nr:GntR family transcriptional regulator [Photobacterium sp. 1_MG-2023]MDO6707342.1 GntR family transcriptional regulator [Photobacterium sp. 1_MG-2023]
MIYELDKSIAYSKIIALIQSEGWPPGTKLSERKISAEIGMDRVPVREALKDLQRYGVIDVSPAKGSFLRRVALKDLQETYEIRELLEVKAVELATIHHPEGSLDQFETQFHTLIAAVNQYSIEAIDEFCSQFHDYLFQLADNQILVETFKPFKLKNALLFQLPAQASSHRFNLKKDILEEHLTILLLVKERNTLACRSSMKAHLNADFALREKYFQ